MILLFDSSSMVVRLVFVTEAGEWRTYEWEAGRSLARDILQYIDQKLKENGTSFNALTAVGVYRGPGSYTGLRIGLTVLNTLAESKSIPIVGASGADWAEECLARLRNGEDDKLVLPEYGGEAHVTLPRK